MKLINEEGGALNCLQLEEGTAHVLSKERIRILKMISKKPMYAAEIARELGIEEQALHYHLKILQKTGLIIVSDYEEKRGGIAKKFTATWESIGIVIKENSWKHFSYYKEELPRIFMPFIEENTFMGKFVVGSPDPHGKYRARSSEFSVLELAMFLGSFATFSFPLYVLDTQLKEEEKKQNLIVAGGPKVNTLTAEINGLLPIRFDTDTFEVYSKFSKKRYSGNIGVIELVQNPFTTNKKILLVGGLNHQGTRAAILAILKKMKQLETGNKYSSKAIAKIVEGFDDNGDGVVDTVEIVE